MISTRRGDGVLAPLIADIVFERKAVAKLPTRGRRLVQRRERKRRRNIMLAEHENINEEEVDILSVSPSPLREMDHTCNREIVRPQAKKVRTHILVQASACPLDLSAFQGLQDHRHQPQGTALHNLVDHTTAKAFLAHLEESLSAENLFGFMEGMLQFLAGQITVQDLALHIRHTLHEHPSLVEEFALFFPSGKAVLIAFPFPFLCVLCHIAMPGEISGT